MISFIMQLQMAIMISFIMQLQMAKNRYSTYHHWSRIHSQPNPSVVLLLVIVATYAASIGLAGGRSAVARPRPASVRTSVDQTKSGGRIVSSVEQPPPSSTHSTLARLSPSNIVEQPLSARSTLPSRSSQSSNLVEQVQPPSARHSSVGRSSPYYSTEQVEPSSARPASALRSSQSTASVVFRNHRPTSFLIPPPCTASPSSPFSLRRSFAAIIISLRSANKQSKARDMPSPKPFATAAGMLRSRLSPSIRTRSGGGDGPSRWASPGHQERPNGYLFNRTPPPPGQSRKWEDWELPCYITSFLTIVILGVGLNAKPDLTIETWAHQKALERLEAQQLALSPSSDDSD